MLLLCIFSLEINEKSFYKTNLPEMLTPSNIKLCGRERIGYVDFPILNLSDSMKII